MCVSGSHHKLAVVPEKGTTIYNNLLYIIERLDKIREEWGGPIIVTSGYRSQALNKAVGGSKTSAHCVGLSGFGGAHSDDGDGVRPANPGKDNGQERRDSELPVAPLRLFANQEQEPDTRLRWKELQARTNNERGEVQRMKLALIIAILAAILYAVSMILSCIYCTAGFLGYPDVWRSKKAEKIYMVCAPLSMLLVLIALIIIFTTM